MTSPNLHRGFAVAGIMIGMFLASLDNTIMGAAMPTIVRELGGLDRYHWVFALYILTTTVTIPVWGRLSDLFGQRRFFTAGVFLFMGGSICAGASRSMTFLILSRAVQGLGAGALLTIAFSLLASLFPPHQRGASMGLLASVWGLSSVIGPPAGGFLAEHGLWRWCFYINLPSGLVSLGLLYASGAGREAKGAKRMPDWPGALLLLLASLALFSGLGMAHQGWLSPRTLGAFAGAALLVALLFWRERSTDDPFIRYPLFRRPVFARSAAAGFFSAIAMFCGIVYMPLFVSGVLGGSPVQAGMILTPFALSWTTLAGVSGRLVNRIGFRGLVATGGLLMAAAYLVVLHLPLAAGWWALAATTASLGAGLGLLVTATTVAAQNAVPNAELGSATSLIQFSRNIGAMIGVSVLGSIMVSALAARGVDRATSEELLDPLRRGMMPAAKLLEVRSALHGSIHIIFWAALAVSLAAAVIGLTLPKGTARSLAHEEHALAPSEAREPGSPA